jgi:UDP-N-acetylbacillosamine N-acetyltransferase
MPRIQQTFNQPEERGALLVYGAGGHGTVVAAAAAAAGWDVRGLVDDNPSVKPSGPWPVMHSGSLADTSSAVIVAIGDNFQRQQLGERLVQQGRTLATVIHPAACVSPLATIGRGAFVGPGAIINPAAQVGQGAIINSGAIVEHHCQVGAYAHIAPGAALGGNVRVGALTLVGLGARVLPVVAIGQRCTIGAGAAVLADGQTVVGVPARAMHVL